MQIKIKFGLWRLDSSMAFRRDGVDVRGKSFVNRSLRGNIFELWNLIKNNLVGEISNKVNSENSYSLGELKMETK